MQRLVYIALSFTILGVVFWALHERGKNIANIAKCGPNWKTEGCNR
jgi:cbb3-type cytochrome oxidase subunit 3